MSDVGAALTAVYDSGIRNAVYHSDFVLHDDRLIIRKGSRLSKRGMYAPEVSLDELSDLTTDAFAFYSVVFGVHERTLQSFRDFKNAFIPYDGHYKGVLECVFDDHDRLVGFWVYWPNGTRGEYARTKNARALDTICRSTRTAALTSWSDSTRRNPVVLAPCRV